MKFEELDCQQRKVVDAVVDSDASILVLGGPGTGKTTTALWSARTFLETFKETPPRVLFLTFSRSAVNQITSRSPGVLSGFEDRIEVSTFHAIAYRILCAFGRYTGYGTAMPSVQTETRRKLLGYDGNKLRYDDLIPDALKILASSTRIRQLLASRWGLVICDEAQDTNELQWNLLQTLASRKLLLLGDVNQMIYTFILGVSPERFRKVHESVDRVIELNPRSHRDPSGAIPALADAIRQRQFNDVAVLEAVKSGRLTIHFDAEGEKVPDLLAQVIRDARGQGSRDVGIFAHSNNSVTEIAEQLNDAGIDHVLVGIPEAHAEALASMSTQCSFGLHLATREEMRESLGLFLTASVRSREAPVLARALIGEAPLPVPIEEALCQLEDALVTATQGNIVDLVEVAVQSWEGLRMTSGRRPWHRAATHFRRLVRSLRQLPASEDSIMRLLEIVEHSRMEALIGLDYSEQGTVKLMNYHQTKGREADTVVHVFRPNDYFGREREPYEKTSRLLNVAVSRARQRVVVILPPNPHGLVEPFTLLRDV